MEPGERAGLLRPLTHGSPKVADAIEAMRKLLGENDVLAYLTMMSVRLVELHRVLKPTGSLYLHCDPTASHYLKVILDAIFGPANFRNEIAWQRFGSHNDARRFGRVADRILFYTRSDAYTFNTVRVGYSEEHLQRGSATATPTAGAIGRTPASLPVGEGPSTSGTGTFGTGGSPGEHAEAPRRRATALQPQGHAVPQELPRRAEGPGRPGRLGGYPDDEVRQ